MFSIVCFLSVTVLAVVVLADYNGTTSTTIGGRTCKRWSFADHNYCRNVEPTMDAPWCYTLDVQFPREKCDVGSDPSFQVSTSITGRPCINHTYCTKTQPTCLTFQAGEITDNEITEPCDVGDGTPLATGFVLKQQFQTHGAYRACSFVVDGTSTLVVSNLRNATGRLKENPRTGEIAWDSENYNSAASVWRWNLTAQVFQFQQFIPTNKSYSTAFITMGVVPYLFVPAIDTTHVYSSVPGGEFTRVASIPVEGATHLIAFFSSESLFLSFSGKVSPIFRYEPFGGGFVQFQSVAPLSTRSAHARWHNSDWLVVTTATGTTLYAFQTTFVATQTFSTAGSDVTFFNTDTIQFLALVDQFAGAVLIHSRRANETVFSLSPIVLNTGGSPESITAEVMWNKLFVVVANRLSATTDRFAAVTRLYVWQEQLNRFAKIQSIPNPTGTYAAFISAGHNRLLWMSSHADGITTNTFSTTWELTAPIVVSVDGPQNVLEGRRIELVVNSSASSSPPSYSVVSAVETGYTISFGKALGIASHLFYVDVADDAIATSPWTLVIEWGQFKEHVHVVQVEDDDIAGLILRPDGKSVMTVALKTLPLGVVRLSATSATVSVFPASVDISPEAYATPITFVAGGSGTVVITTRSDVDGDIYNGLSVEWTVAADKTSHLLVLIVPSTVIPVGLLVAVIVGLKYFKRKPLSIDSNNWLVDMAEIEFMQLIGEGSFGKVHAGLYRNSTVAIKTLSWASTIIPTLEPTGTRSDELREEMKRAMNRPSTEGKKNGLQQVWNTIKRGSSFVVARASIDSKSRQSTKEHDNAIDRFVTEIKMMCRLRHPNIVCFMGACFDENIICMVMEYMNHGSLYHLLKAYSQTDSQPLKWLRRIRMAKDASAGMLYLHSLNPPIVHNDLKSLNLLVDDHFIVKVCDFGLSKIKPTNEDVYVRGEEVVGTMLWMPPEVILGNQFSTVAVDVYSFGIIMWELAALQSPFCALVAEKGVVATTLQVAENNIRPEIPSDTPPDFQTLMTQCWDRSAEARPTFKTVHKMLCDLFIQQHRRHSLRNYQHSSRNSLYWLSTLTTRSHRVHPSEVQINMDSASMRASIRVPQRMEFSSRISELSRRSTLPNGGKK